MTVEYIPVPVPEGLEIRGDQTSVTPTVTPYTVAKGETPAPDGSNYTKYATKTYSFVNGTYVKDATLLTPTAE